ncbi:MAG: hypothetical protein S4CHLAM37_01960 [Chlamydiia bacterium]|nr:hypothetical protein [Chlamydiia bacterium]
MAAANSLYQTGFRILAIREAIHSSPISLCDETVLHLQRALQPPPTEATETAAPTFLANPAVEDLMDSSDAKIIITQYIARNKIADLGELLNFFRSSQSEQHSPIPERFFYYNEDEIALLRKSVRKTELSAKEAGILNRSGTPYFPKETENIAAWKHFLTTARGMDETDLSSDDEFYDATDSSRGAAAEAVDGLPERVEELAISKAPAQEDPLLGVIKSAFVTNPEFAIFLREKLIPKEIENFTYTPSSSTFSITCKKRYKKRMKGIPAEGMTSLENCDLFVSESIEGRIDAKAQTIHFRGEALSMKSNGWIPVSGALTYVELDIRTGEIFLGTNYSILPRLGPYDVAEFRATFKSFSWT